MVPDLSGANTAETWRWPTIPYSADVEERVELYFYSPSENSWHVIGWNFYYIFIYHHIYIIKLPASYKFSGLHNHISKRTSVMTRAVVLVNCYNAKNCCRFIGWVLTEWCSLCATGLVISYILKPDIFQ